MSQRIWEGGCQCRSIRYRITGEPLTVYVCHCTDCQRRTGSAFGMSMLLQKNQFEVLAGTPKTYSFIEPGGRQRSGAYCERCVIRLWGESARTPDIMYVRPGSLDDTSGLEPAGHIWTRSKQPWVVIPADALQVEGQPEDMRMLIRAWRERVPPT
jgi:hypothetical protein